MPHVPLVPAEPVDTKIAHAASKGALLTEEAAKKMFDTHKYYRRQIIRATIAGQCARPEPKTLDPVGGLRSVAPT